MIKYINVSDLALNPIVGSSVASIINKVGDYASVGIPVINTQNCKEYIDIIDNFGCGYNVVPFNHNKIKEIIIECSTKQNKKIFSNELNLASVAKLRKSFLISS